MSTDGVIEELRRRLNRYPRDRYPVQHATTQFHLGQALLQAEQHAAAIEALRTCLQWFPAPLVVERAKAVNLLGAALRATGDHEAAAEAFTRAGAVFAERGLPAEHGAALFNLGLVQRDTGQPTAAARTLAEARRRFADGPIAARAAAALQHGGALLEAGETSAAVEALQAAVGLAEAGGHREAVGTAANTLGLAQLADGDPDAAAESFGLAVAAHPRSVRPDAFAMAKANLALAQQQAGRAEAARLAARQAIAVPDVPPVVRAQARQTIDDVGSAAGSAVLVVLADEPAEHWTATVRDEMVRWAAVSPGVRREEARWWVEGVMDRPAEADTLHHVWLTVLLELPPSDLDAIVTATLEALVQVDRSVAEQYRSAVSRAMARFPVPQLLRLRDRFNALSAAVGQEAAWH